MVSAAEASLGLDAVSELTQPLDVASQGALGDVETLGELRAGPPPVRLQQPEQLEHARCRIRHDRHLPRTKDRI
jgi:hypothetical protein